MQGSHSRQHKLIWEIERRGPTWAMETLQAFKETLQIFEKHRQLIIDQLK